MTGGINIDNVIGRALDELYRIFGILNQTYYEGKLPVPVLTVQKGRPNNLGWFTLEKVWKNKDDDEKARYEINITAGNLNRDTKDIVGTLQHEMVHFANRISGIRDCNGQIHNKRFRTLAEEVGLVCEKSKKYGWGCTECGDELVAFIAEKIVPDKQAFDYFRQNDLVSHKKAREKKTFKYTCPECGLVVKAEKDKNIKCGDCSVELKVEGAA